MQTGAIKSVGSGTIYNKGFGKVLLAESVLFSYDFLVYLIQF